MKRGFTMVELLVVIAMLMLLIGAVTSSVSSAQRRAKIVRATVEAQEMTKAILAFENFGKGYSLSAHKIDPAAPATEQNLGFIIGKATMENGQSGDVPVLYNASLKDGRFLDPWGRPYYVTIRQRTFKTETAPGANNSLATFVTFPNYNRRPADK